MQGSGICLVPVCLPGCSSQGEKLIKEQLLAEIRVLGLQWVFPARERFTLINSLGLVTWVTKDLQENPLQARLSQEEKKNNQNPSCAGCSGGICIVLLPGKVSWVKLHQGSEAMQSCSSQDEGI